MTFFKDMAAKMEQKGDCGCQGGKLGAKCDGGKCAGDKDGHGKPGCDCGGKCPGCPGCPDKDKQDKKPEAPATPEAPKDAPAKP